MAGLVPAIHAYFVAKQGVDARHRAWGITWRISCLSAAGKRAAKSLNFNHRTAPSSAEKFIG